MNINSYLRSDQFALLIVFAFFLFSIYYFLNAESRKRSLKTTQAQYEESFVTKTPPIKAFNLIKKFATQNGYRIDDSDPQKLGILLNKKTTPLKFGLLYLIYIRQQEEDGTLVEVGATNKYGRIFFITPAQKYIVADGLQSMLYELKDIIHPIS